nr:MAG TPA: hypothetical protein [Caudoviricetes sp.]
MPGQQYRNPRQIFSCFPVPYDVIIYLYKYIYNSE